MTLASPVPDPDGDWGSIARYAMEFNGYQHFGEEWLDVAVGIRDRFDETGELPNDTEDLRAQLFIEFRMDRFVDNEEWTLAPDDNGDLGVAGNPEWGPQSPTQVRRRAIVRRLRELSDGPATADDGATAPEVSPTGGVYRDDPDHPARFDKNGRREPTRSPRFDNWLYCLVWPDHDLLKFGLSQGVGNARSGAAHDALRKYLHHEGVAPGQLLAWRARLPFLDGAPWGDCQRFEMVAATALKRRLGAQAASAVGLEWLTRPDLQQVDWLAELAAAAEDAVDFSALDGHAQWEEYNPALGTPATNAHRTMRNNRGVCALKGCEAPLPAAPCERDAYRYCSVAHADEDAALRGAVSRDDVQTLQPVSVRDALVQEIVETTTVIDQEGQEVPPPKQLPELDDPEFDDWDDE